LGGCAGPSAERGIPCPLKHFRTRGTKSEKEKGFSGGGDRNNRWREAFSFNNLAAGKGFEKKEKRVRDFQEKILSNEIPSREICPISYILRGNMIEGRNLGKLSHLA